MPVVGEREVIAAGLPNEKALVADRAKRKPAQTRMREGTKQHESTRGVPFFSRTRLYCAVNFCKELPVRSLVEIRLYCDHHKHFYLGSVSTAQESVVGQSQ